MSHTFSSLPICFNKKFGSMLAAVVHPAYPDSFIASFQSRSTTDNSYETTLRELLENVERSNNLFEQYPVDVNVVKKTAFSIFIEDRWLMKKPSLVSFDGETYVAGGRHRIMALAAGFKSIAVAYCKEEEEAEELYNEYLDQVILCTLETVETKQDLLSLVNADNSSRTMRKAEKEHLHIQLLGASTAVEDVGQAVMTGELTNKERRDAAAQAFTRRQGTKLKPQTLQVLGEKLVSYIIFGLTPDEKLTAKTDLVIDSVNEFNTQVDRAWEVLVDVVKDKAVIARDANKVVKEVIDRLSNDVNVSQKPDTLLELHTDKALDKINDVSNSTEENLNGVVHTEEVKTKRRGRPKKEAHSDDGDEF